MKVFQTQKKFFTEVAEFALSNCILSWLQGQISEKVYIIFRYQFITIGDFKQNCMIGNQCNDMPKDVEYPIQNLWLPSQDEIIWIMFFNI